MLDPDSLDRLRALYPETHGEHLPDAAAHAIGNRLLRLFDLLAQPPAPPENRSGDSTPRP